MEKEFEEISPEVWKPTEKDQQVEGILIGKEAEVGINKSNLYHLERNKEQIRVWGSTVLDDRMRFCNVGDYVRITYKGTTENKRGQNVKIFKVERAKVIKEEKKLPPQW